jgi:hypothetical protein
MRIKSSTTCLYGFIASVSDKLSTLISSRIHCGSELGLPSVGAREHKTPPVAGFSGRLAGPYPATR